MKPSDIDIKVMQQIFSLLSHLLKNEKMTINFNKVPSEHATTARDAIAYLESKQLIASTKDVRDNKTGATLINHVGIINTIPDDYMKYAPVEVEAEIVEFKKEGTDGDDSSGV